MTKQEFIDRYVISCAAREGMDGGYCTAHFEQAESAWIIRQNRILKEAKKLGWQEESAENRDAPDEKRYFFDIGGNDRLTICHGHNVKDQPLPNEFTFYLDIGPGPDAVFQGDFVGTLDEAKAHATSECREWMRERFALIGGLW